MNWPTEIDIKSSAEMIRMALPSDGYTFFITPEAVNYGHHTVYELKIKVRISVFNYEGSDDNGLGVNGFDGETLADCVRNALAHCRRMFGNSPRRTDKPDHVIVLDEEVPVVPPMTQAEAYTVPTNVTIPITPMHEPSVADRTGRGGEVAQPKSMGEYLEMTDEQKMALAEQERMNTK